MIASTSIVKLEVETLLGDLGGVVNSLDFCPASLKSLGFGAYFLHNWKAVTVNL